jgi:hypothetical protein
MGQGRPGIVAARTAGKREVETEQALQIIPRISLKDKAISIREAIVRRELRSGEV